MNISIVKDGRGWLVYESFRGSHEHIKTCWSFNSAWDTAESVLEPFDTNHIHFFTSQEDFNGHK